MLVSAIFLMVCLNWSVTPHGSCNFEGEGLTPKSLFGIVVAVVVVV
jgi:hypothetical protein